MAKKKKFEVNDMEMRLLTDKIIKKSGFENQIRDYHRQEILDDVKVYMSYWGDKERVMEYVLKHNFYTKYLSFNMCMVDVFGVKHPTAFKLYHDFHNMWGKELDEVIAEAIELYPDEFDFDKAFYYTEEKMKEVVKRQIEEMKERNRKKNDTGN